MVNRPSWARVNSRLDRLEVQIAYVVRLAELLAEHHALELRFSLVTTSEGHPSLFDPPSERCGSWRCDNCGAGARLTDPERCAGCGAEILA